MCSESDATKKKKKRQCGHGSSNLNQSLLYTISQLFLKSPSKTGLIKHGDHHGSEHATKILLVVHSFFVKLYATKLDSLQNFKFVLLDWYDMVLLWCKFINGTKMSLNTNNHSSII